MENQYGEEESKGSPSLEGLVLGAGGLAAACLATTPIAAALCGGSGIAALTIAVSAVTRPQEPQAEPPCTLSEEMGASPRCWAHAVSDGLHERTGEGAKQKVR